MKPRKIVRSKYMYRKHYPKIGGTVLFVCLLALLVGIGYIVSREWAKRFGPNAVPPSSSVAVSETVSSAPVSSASSASQAQTQSLKGKLLPLSKMDTTTGSSVLSNWLQEAKANGDTAVYLNLKTDNGTITYNTTNERAKKYRTIAQSTANLDTLVKEVKDAGMTPVARLSALKDPLAAHISRKNSYAYGNTTNITWRDSKGNRWLNPYMENARTYICDLCKEVSDHGIKTIVLENVVFPSQHTSKMSTIETTPSRAEILNQLMKEAQAAAGDAVVYNGFDVDAIDNADSLDALLSGMEGEHLAPIISLDDIQAMDNAFSKKIPTVAEAAYIDNSEQETAMSILLTVQQKDSAMLPLIAEKDEIALQPALTKSGIINSIAF